MLLLHMRNWDLSTVVVFIQLVGVWGQNLKPFLLLENWKARNYRLKLGGSSFTLLR